MIQILHLESHSQAVHLVWDVCVCIKMIDMADVNISSLYLAVFYILLSALVCSFLAACYKLFGFQQELESGLYD